MSQLLRSVFVSIFVLGGMPPAMATDMECGNNYIEDDQFKGQTKEQIRQACGNPTAEVDGDWIYNKDDSQYRLHFDGNGRLDSMTENE
jgi:hypothetical protein